MTARFDAIANRFPRWKTTATIMGDVERHFAPYSVEQVAFAAAQHRLERRGDDPDIGELIRRLKGTGARHAVQPQDPREQLAAYNARPNTPEEDRWDALCESWRADLYAAKRQPDFTPEGWARAAYPLFVRDIATFGHTSKTFATAYLVRLARDCGVKLQIRQQPEAAALASMIVEPEPEPDPEFSAPDAFDAMFGTSDETKGAA